MSPGYQLHPEFGLLCPSRSLRRKVRLVSALLVVAGLLAWKAGHLPNADDMRVVAHDDDAGFNTEAAPAAEERTSTAADSSHPFEGGRTACAAYAGTRADGTCGPGTARKPPRQRAVNEAPTIAALPVGRSPPPAPESLVAPEPSVAPETSVALLTPTVADATISTPAAADRAERSETPAPAPRKVKKPPPRNNNYEVVRERRWRDDPWAPRAYAYPDDRYLRSRNERWWGWEQQVRW